jgi:GT2 family glycosyltransferase
LISVSVVSHGQGALVGRLLDDLARIPAVRRGEVILTYNVDEPDVDAPAAAALPLRAVRNRAPRGFGANHNAAFAMSRGDFFCVLNPDVRLAQDPFPALLEALEARGVGVAAPLVVSPGGAVEDSARRFHTPLALLGRALGRGAIDYPGAATAFSPDWVAGMFMLFRREAFERVGGFDERYFLYYEDIDVCARLRLAGYDVRVVPAARAVHDAQRRSHRDLRYLAAHLRSALRYFTSDTYTRIMRRR